MVDYSQYGQQQVLLDYWGDRKGYLVDVGACDGLYLSNSRALLEMGWEGMLVEPHPETFKKLVENSKGLSVTPVECACGDVSGRMTLNIAPITLAGLGEVSSLLPLGNLKDYFRSWSGYNDNWTEVVVPVKRVGELCPRKIDLLLVDAEGYDLHVLKGVDWAVNAPEMVVAEISVVDSKAMDEYMQTVGYKVFHTGNIDLFFVKKGG